MCGIIGKIGGARASEMDAALSSLSHRGPDDLGAWFDESVGCFLGHARLSIVARNQSASQPMLSRDGRYVLVFNGEIYNYRELSLRLAEDGIDASGSEGDSRILLEAYAHWGLRVIPMLRGMFAFCIVDLRPQSAGVRALLVRDRFGIKPLYYSAGRAGFLFASETSALRRATLENVSLDRAGFVDLIQYGSLFDSGSVFSGICELEPGTTLLVGANGSVLQTERYWPNYSESTPVGNGRNAIAPTPSDPVRVVRGLIERGAREQMAPEDAPGILLSGGIDSSLVAALAAQYANSSPIATTIGVVGTSLEQDVLHARQVARRWGLELRERWIDESDVDSLASAWLEATDQPSGDGFNTFVACRELANDCKVILSGLGADEIFGGYPHFGTSESNGGSLCARLRRAFGAMRNVRSSDVSPPDPRAVLAELVRVRSIADPAACLAPGLTFGPVARRDAAGWGTGLDRMQLLSLFEIKGYLRGVLLRDADVMSMASSIELRPTFLDHELVEYVWSLPQERKLVNGRLKPLLVDACRDLIDDAIVNRQKTGFSMPYGRWIQGPLQKRVRSAFSSKTATSLLHPDYLSQLKREAEGASPASYRTWAHWVLVEWLNLRRIDVSSLAA